MFEGLKAMLNAIEKHLPDDHVPYTYADLEKFVTEWEGKPELPTRYVNEDDLT